MCYSFHTPYPSIFSPVPPLNAGVKFEIICLKNKDYHTFLDQMLRTRDAKGVYRAALSQLKTHVLSWFVVQSIPMDICRFYQFVKKKDSELY